MELDPILLSRIQFAFVISFHILFPAFTIGLASWLVTLEATWLVTKQQRYWHLYQFWLKIFAVSFGMGVVSGIVMSFQFGTNWSEFSRAAGNIVGPLLHYEVLTAFFLEATFLGVMLFGAKRVSKKFHFFATCMVAIGVLISTFWIISANSWMHTPAGYSIQEGIFYPEDWFQIVFNPSFPYRLAHMVLAAYLTTCFVIGGVSAWYLVKQRCQMHARFMLMMTVVFAVLVVPVQIFLGDLHGLNVRDHQPIKLAAIEGHWETHEGAPLILFALPDETRELNRFELAIPKLASLILTHEWNGKVQGLKDFPIEDRPPVIPVFWSFRIMVTIALVMLFVGVYGTYLLMRDKLYATPWFHRLMVIMGPSGFIAVLSGWFTTEIGRQPFVVYGLVRTKDVATSLPAENVLFSLLVYGLVYTIIFGFGIYYLLKIIRQGPNDTDELDQLYMVAHSTA